MTKIGAGGFLKLTFVLQSEDERSGGNTLLLYI